MGLFGYDLGRRFESLPTEAEQDITLPDMAVGIYDWALIVDHQLQRVSLLSHSDVQARHRWLENQQIPVREPFSLTSSWQSNMTREQYGERFRQVQRYLHSGDCYQVNLAQRFQAHYQGDEWLAFVRLNHANRAPFSAFIRLEEGRFSAFHLSVLFCWKTSTSRRARLKARCPDLKMPMPIVCRLNHWRTPQRIRRKT